MAYVRPSTMCSEKKRTGQLISWGVMVEEIFKSTDEAGRQKLVESAKKHLKDRDLQRALEGFSRLGWTSC